MLIKRIFKILAFILISILIAVLIIIALNFENFKSLYNSMTMTKEEISKEIKNEKNKVEKELKELYDIELDQISKDKDKEDEEEIKKQEENLEKDKHEENIVSTNQEKKEDKNSVNTRQEIKNEKPKLNNKDETKNKKSTNKKQAKPSKAKEIVKLKIATLYALKSQFSSEIKSLESKAYAEYKEQQKSGKVDKPALISKYTAIAGELESKSDYSVEKVLSELKKELESIGEPTSIVETLRSSYQKEKSLTKSLYIP